MSGRAEISNLEKSLPEKVLETLVISGGLAIYCAAIGINEIFQQGKRGYYALRGIKTERSSDDGESSFSRYTPK